MTEVTQNHANAYGSLSHCLHESCMRAFSSPKLHALLHNEPSVIQTCEGPGCELCKYEQLQRDQLYNTEGKHNSNLQMSQMNHAK